MSDLPCRVSLDELNHDLAQSRGIDPDDVDKRATELALALIGDGKRLGELVNDYEIDIFGQLARCMSELESACNGKPISRDACLNALSLIERLLMAKATEEMRDEALRQLSEAERLRGADDETY